MTRLADQPTEEDIREGLRSQIFVKWKEDLMSLREIAYDIDLPIAEVAQLLKEAQKSRMETGVDSYAKKHGS